MKKFAAACALSAAFIAVITGTAGAHTTTRSAAPDTPTITWGVADDGGKYADDGGTWFNSELKGANLSEERWTLSWSPDRPTTIDELPFLQRSAPEAQKDGIKVELALYGRPASANDPDAFCDWAGTVAETVSAWGIHDYVVWNEPNTALYWSPQPTTVGLVTKRSVTGIGDALNFVIDELGWQTDTARYTQYVNNENVRTVDEATQTAYLKTVAEKYYACDPTVATVNLFLLMD